MSHTPGPWHVFPIEGISGGSWGIVRTYTPPHTATAVEQTVANANLIAAAPDLLEQRNELLAALENFVANWGSIYRSDMETAVKLAKAAIAKAKGDDLP